MSNQDPIADALTRIRNAQAVKHKQVVIPSCKLLLEILRVMHAEGFIEGFEVSTQEQGASKVVVTVVLKYFQGRHLKRRGEKQSYHQRENMLHRS